MSIDKSKVKAGDRVKASIKYGSDSVWITPDWVKVKNGYLDDLLVNGESLNYSSLTVTDHEPGYADLEEAVERAKTELANAEKALADAKNPTPKVGDKVRILRGRYKGVTGTVIKVEESVFSWGPVFSVKALYGSYNRSFYFYGADIEVINEIEFINE